MLFRRGLGGVAAACALAVLPCAGAAAAQSDPFSEYASLAQEERSPAPLTPVVMPAILGGSEALPASVLTGAGGTYSLAFNHFVGTGIHQKIDASILLQGLGRRTLPGRREHFGSLYTYKKTRVRGHAGLILRARFSPVRSLAWREQGQLFELSTNTPRTISVGALRTVATGLQHLRGAYTAQVISGDGGAQEAQALLGDRVLSLTVSWTAPCARASGEAAVDRGGEARLGWLALGAGGAFARGPLAVAQTLPARPALAPPALGPWSFSVTGSATPAGGQLTFQTSSASGGESCGIGPQALSLARLPRQQRMLTGP